MRGTVPEYKLINVLPIQLCLTVEETDQAFHLFSFKLYTFSIYNPGGKTIIVADKKNSANTNSGC